MCDGIGDIAEAVPAGGRRDTVFFISDAHFGLYADERDKAGRFSELAAEVRRCASDLYIIGDLFDFWIEYRFSIRPDYFPVLYELRSLVEAGVRVHYLAGNHDFALGPFLERAIGITVRRGALRVPLQGRKVYMRHGDDIIRKNPMNALLRNGFLQALYKAIHPTAGVGIGVFFSTMSRKKYHNAVMPEKDLQKYLQTAQMYLKKEDCDLVILAHTHRGELKSLDGGEYCNTGSWMDNYDYAILRNGKIQLLKWGT